MSTAAKDPRINDLFTEGSHHCNISVVTLNHNLFFGKDHTQRRNCHYLVFFNNPVDRQPVTTLGRQMYPSRRNFFLQKFDEATERSYAYLLVDLKPTTLDSLRLRTDALGTGIEKEKGCGGGCGGGGTPGSLSLSTLRTRIRSRVGFERSPDTWMSRRRTSRQEMQERRRWYRRYLRLRTRMLP